MLKLSPVLYLIATSIFTYTGIIPIYSSDQSALNPESPIIEEMLPAVTLTPEKKSTLTIKEQTLKEELQVSSSRLIPAEDLKDFTKTHRNCPFFDLTRDGFFLKQEDQSLTLFQIQQDGNVKEFNKFMLPKIEKKLFFDATIISKDFIQLHYGEPSDDLAHPSSTDDTSLGDNLYKNCEYSIWDINLAEGFKVENPDFSTCYLVIHEMNNPEKMLVNESIYKLEGDHINQSRYRYYNLFTRKFQDQTVLDFNLNYINLITSTNKNGDYKFKYATSSFINKEKSFLKVKEKEDGSVVIGDIVYSIPNSNSINYSYQNALRDNLLIIHRSAGDGLLVPYIVDLSRKKPTEKPLLSDDEMDELESDVYDVGLIDGCLSYTTHFLERKIHHRDYGKLGQIGEFLKDINSFSEKFGFKNDKLEMATKIFDIQFFTVVKDMLLNIFNKHNIVENKKMYKYSIIKSIFTENFAQYLVNTLKPMIPSYYPLTLIKSDVVKTADQKFKMPIYYTTPEKPNADGWFIIDVHGGPHLRIFNECDMIQQFWTSRGFPHLRLNIRGSTGFGNTYENSADGNWYDIIDDIKVAIDWAELNGLGTKSIVMGGSFGGYAAAAAYAKGYADVAITMNGLFDLDKELEITKTGKLTYTVDNILSQFGTTQEDRKRNSVTTYLSTRPEAKMLIIAGLKDKICAPEQSDILYNKMVELGNDVDYVTMADEGHSPIKPENRLMMFRVAEEYLGKITGYSYEPNGYDTLKTTEGVVYQSFKK